MKFTQKVARWMFTQLGSGPHSSFLHSKSSHFPSIPGLLPVMMPNSLHPMYSPQTRAKFTAIFSIGFNSHVRIIEFDKGPKPIQWRKYGIYNKWCWSNWIFRSKETMKKEEGEGRRNTHTHTHTSRYFLLGPWSFTKLLKTTLFNRWPQEISTQVQCLGF